MSKERKQLVKKMEGIKDRVRDLRNQYVLLNRQLLMLCDEHCQYVVKKETFGRGKNKKTALIGRLHWKEDFKDEDTGEVMTIERSQPVTNNGEWIVDLGF